VKRRTVLFAVAAGLAAPFAASAQQQGRVRRIGILSARSRSTTENPDSYFDAFVRAMRELGHEEGKNLSTEWRFADGKNERLPALAAELVRLQPEIIVTHATAGALAAQRATRTIPIVFTAAGDPVKSGLVESLARPGGNITGLSLLTADIFPKQLELLRTMLPRVTRVAVLVNPGSPNRGRNLRNLRDAAQKLGIEIIAEDPRTPEEFARAFAAMKRAGAQAVIIFADSFFIFHRRQIAELAISSRLPSMYYYVEDTQAGGLMSYGQNNADYYRRAATYVDKILKGAKAADLPIEQPTKIHLAINLKTAKALGISVSKELLFRADEVIE
jgi:putative ABC transport system substrate-binding protein